MWDPTSSVDFHELHPVDKCDTFTATLFDMVSQIGPVYISRDVDRNLCWTSVKDVYVSVIFCLSAPGLPSSLTNLQLFWKYMPALNISSNVQKEFLWAREFAQVSNTRIPTIQRRIVDCEDVRNIVSRQYVFANPVDDFARFSIKLRNLELGLQSPDTWE